MSKNRYSQPNNNSSIPGFVPNLTRNMSKSRDRNIPVQNTLETTRAIIGPDVSHWQNKIDWNKMVNNQKNMGFAMCKATEGTNFIDPNFVYNITQMCETFSTPAASRTFGGHTNQIAFGVYHFAKIIPTYKDTDFQTQADFFYNTVVNSVKNVDDHFPNFWVLDWEDASGENIPYDTRANYAKAFVQQLHSNLMNKFGQSYVPKIFIYSEYYYWGNIVNDATKWFTTYGPKLWMAAYITNNVLPETETINKYNIVNKYTNETPTLNLVNSLGKWMVWQYTSSASVPGVLSRCDVSVARTSDDWNLDFYQT